MSTLDGRIAGAPITWGVCEVPGWGFQLPVRDVLADMARLDLRATEAGPEGFLPAEPAAARDLLAAHGLRLAGGFVPAVLHDPRRREPEIARVAAEAARLAAAGADVIVVAAATGGDGYERGARLDEDGWQALSTGLARTIEAAERHGLRAALHPHHGTVIERAGDVWQVLERSTVGLCLDSGHLLVGGADPRRIADEATDRIVHVHLKDADAGLGRRVRAGAIGYRDAVAAGLYVPLGTGDVDVAGIVGRLEGRGYAGWYVLEHDTVLDAAPDGRTHAARAAGASVTYLRALADGLPEGPVRATGAATTTVDASSDPRRGGES